MREVERSFRAMNTDVQAVVVVDEDDAPAAGQALSEVEDLFASVEAALSRFRPDSELSRLNRAAADSQGRQLFRSSPLLFEVAAAALEAARETSGLFDPTVLGALVAAGYDRSFELLTGDVTFTSKWEIRPSWDTVILDSANQTISLPPGLGPGSRWHRQRLDGGSRGRPVARVPVIFGIDAGGDLYCRGETGRWHSWTVGVEDPRAPGRDLAVLEDRACAVATSSVARRRWQRNGRQQHHLIDPRTILPAETDVLSATVIAQSVARAEIPCQGCAHPRPHGRAPLQPVSPDGRDPIRKDGRCARTTGLRGYYASMVDGCRSRALPHSFSEPLSAWAEGSSSGPLLAVRTGGRRARIPRRSCSSAPMLPTAAGGVWTSTWCCPVRFSAGRPAERRAAGHLSAEQPDRSVGLAARPPAPWT